MNSKFQNIRTSSAIFFFVLISKILTAQEIILDPSTGQYLNQQVVNIEVEMAKDKLFDKAMEWVALNYKSAQDVIQYSDKLSGKIICKGSFSTDLFMKSGWIRHTLTIELKEGRYRQTYSDLSYYSSGTGEMAFESKKLGFKKKIFRETSENIKFSTESLKKYFKSTNDEW